MSSISQLSPSELSPAEIVASDRADAVADDAVPSGRRRRFSAWLALAVPTAIYVGIQLSSLLVFVTGVTAAALALCAATFFVRIFAITGVYHRYFSHRTYRTSRVVQFLLAVLGASAVQKGPLWWASVHRTHHSDSDGPGDPHSPRRGFWYAHQGWIFDERWDAVREDRIKDLTRYPELVWLDRWHFLPPLALAVLCYAMGGFTGLVWGFAVSTTLTWHATYSINSLAHRFGSVRFETGDDSRNNFWLALLTLGEGWHNNHHYYQSCARQGLYWWEIDITYYVLRGLAAVGLIWDLKQPPARVYEVARAGRTGAPADGAAAALEATRS
jgi:stearoyl-CoA desaturase (delta-9 desaturase)